MSRRGERPLILRVAPSLAGRVRLASVHAEPVVAETAAPSLLEEIARLCEDLRERHRGLAPSEIDGLQPARELYRLFGIDPTKTRPSSESLLRRVLRDKPLPRISGAVDLGNFLALDFLLPIGLYDAEAVEGPAELRPGKPGESYRGVRKDEVHLAGRPVLADRAGPFGNPTADSMRTAVRASTRALWLVIFAPSTVARAVLERRVETARSAFERHLAPPGQTVRTAGSVIESRRA